MTIQKNKSEIETELKIKLSPKDMEKVFRTLVKKEGASKISHQFTPRIYNDTPELLLHQKKISLRVQYNPGKNGHLGSHEQTIKIKPIFNSPLVKGVLRRKECRNKLTNHQPDLQSITDREAQEILTPLKCKNLVPVFTAIVERRFFDLSLRTNKNNGIVEIAFDSGYLVLQDNCAYQDFSEIEVELKKGGISLIDIVKNKIMRIAPSARIQTMSKAKQGVQLRLKAQEIV